MIKIKQSRTQAANSFKHTRNRSIKCFARATAFVLHGQFLSRIAVFHSELKKHHFIITIQFTVCEYFFFGKILTLAFPPLQTCCKFVVLAR